jgi:hypothetical protein
MQRRCRLRKYPRALLLHATRELPLVAGAWRLTRVGGQEGRGHGRGREHCCR